MKLKEYLLNEARNVERTDEYTFELDVDLNGSRLYIHLNDGSTRNLGQDFENLFYDLDKDIRPEYAKFKETLNKETFEECCNIFKTALGLIKAKAVEANMKLGKFIKDKAKK